MALQPNRILRFLMVLTAVLLTIFIYASYYSNTVMTFPTRMHASAAAAASSILVANSDLVKSNNQLQLIQQQQIIDSTNNLIVVDKQNSGKGLKSNSDFDVNSNSSYVQQPQQYPDIGAGPQPSQSNSNISQNSVPKPITGTVSITNKIVNATASSSVQLSRLQPPSKFANSTINVTAAVNQTKSTTVIQTDPLKGIRTGNMYESGHMDVNPQLCPEEGDAVKLLIMITSAPKNIDARLAIRQTWGHYGNRRDVTIGFVLGRSGSQPIEDALNAENYLYGDLIRGHFIDSYNNLTLKTISILEWIDHACPHATFVLKTDDDMFINVPKLLSFVDKHQTDKRTIYGRLAKKWKPIRNQKSKYYVSPIQFSAVIFPQFTTGPAYLMTADIVHDLYLKSLEQTYLKLEDVYTTGIVAQMLNIKRIHVNEFLNRRIAFNPCNIRKAISIHMIKTNEQFDLWKKLLDTSTKCK